MAHERDVRNDNSSVSADPYVRWDAKTGAYWAYSTEGADDGWYYGIYTSPDLSTWSKIRAEHEWYFLFHSGRYTEPRLVANTSNTRFEEASKIGVAVSRSPAGPFVEIANRPIDYYPFDPIIMTLILMTSPYLVPPSSPAVGDTAPLGTYIPSIDPNVLWDDDGSIWLSSRAMPKTLPVVHESYRTCTRASRGMGRLSQLELPGPTRKDGFVPVISYKLQPQAWENAHVSDYVASNGTLKNRRWSEGSTTIKRYDSFGQPVYFLTYSANNYESPDYGIGYAYAHSVTGPYYKSGSNPILSQDASRTSSTWHLLDGHGSILYYPHHARPNSSADRYLYTSRLFVEPDSLYIGFGADAGDLRLPSGVAPFSIKASPLADPGNGTSRWNVSVHAGSGAPFDLASPQNRVWAEAADGSAVSVEGSIVTVAGAKSGESVRVVYQRARSNATEPWVDVAQSRGLAWELSTVEAEVSL
ncbi:glycosyl hydrolase [Fomitopsis serialis]|uniref:glycosyl hydrolase n=1 Tax=Fomitopsis serialis TaxID=139415 RepID=UPI002008D89F|nr:glycosyl hydrolase [Neoantrodia serialis]KAH9919536.1 glycosyl hydrolase [Neoantrodia serialis]